MATRTSPAGSATPSPPPTHLISPAPRPRSRLGDVFLPSPPPPPIGVTGLQRVTHTRQVLLRRRISSTRDWSRIGVGEMLAGPRVGCCIAESYVQSQKLKHSYRAFKQLNFSSIQEQRRTKTRSVTNPFCPICNPCSKQNKKLK
jgi:hypothetical protein